MSKRKSVAAVIAGIAGIILVLAIVLFGAWGWFTRQAIPKTQGTVEVAGLVQEVEIVRDEYGVPHIYAHTTEDLFFAQGYVHAQDRFWQMEFQRRTGAGRLSELFGEATVETDAYLRHFGFSGLSQRTYELLDDNTRNIVDAYTEGVNAYISDRQAGQLGLEFAFLGMQGVDSEIEPWTAVDSLIWGYMLMFDQSDQLRTELRNIDLLASLGEEMYADLRPPYRQDRPVIIETAELDSLAGRDISSTLSALDPPALAYLANLNRQLAGKEPMPQQMADLGFGSSGASNSFAIGPRKSATGTAILGDDPHMSINMPALWYEVGMHCVEKSKDCIHSFRGFSLPGVPGILIGHNDRIAWGLTNAAFDAEDVYIERINPQDPDQYEVNDEWVDMTKRREEIFVHGREDPHVIIVRYTRHGLVASDFMVDDRPFSSKDGQTDLFALAYAWTALLPSMSVQAAHNVIRAQNWQEFDTALADFHAGKQNWIYADVDGNIGYVMPGRVPVRAGGDGTLPVPGWNDDFAWEGFIPYADAPRVYNPDKGFIVTANNPQVRADDYPYLLNVYHDRGQRAERFMSQIAADQDGITIEEAMAMQTDNGSLSALEIIPYLAQLSFSDSDVTAARDMLLDWDAQMLKESPEAALFNIFWSQFVPMTFDDQLPPGRPLGTGTYTSDIIYNLLPDPDNQWWDDVLATPDMIEDRDDILREAFEAAYAEGVETFGSDLSAWRWGDLHTITFRNETLGNSGIGVIENIFNRGPYATSGSVSVPQKTSWSGDGDYTVSSIPALRQVIDLGDLDNSRMVHSVGQSGHPMDPNYDSLIEMWRDLEYHASNWSREAAESGGSETLILEPASEQ